MNNRTEHSIHHPWPAALVGLLEPVHFVAEGVISGFSEIYRLIAKGFKALHRKLAIDRTIAEMSRLDDHILKDIGVDRYEIPAFVRSLVENPENKMAEATRHQSEIR